MFKSNLLKLIYLRDFVSREMYQRSEEKLLIKEVDVHEDEAKVLYSPNTFPPLISTQTCPTAASYSPDSSR